MTEQKKTKEGAYASLTGFKRAVPIILAALAVFVALCFITKNTGALGKGISNAVLGLFSIGGYFIPFFLLVHAFFFPSDIQKQRLISRIIFSAVAIISISCMTHAITYFGGDYSFSASEAYKMGVDGKGGGFIGALIGFCLTKIFGSVGVIIIAVLVFALYITYFFSAGKTALARALLKVLTAISDFFTSAGERKKERAERAAQKKELQKREELAEKQEILMDDEFFDADNGLRELKISELGIKETRDSKEIELRPALQDKVIHNGEIHKKSVNAGKANSASSAEEASRSRFINLDYSTTDSVYGLSSSTDGVVFEQRHDDIIYEDTEDEINPFSETEKAEDVFGGKFEPFDFKLSQELAAKKSSKAVSEETDKNDGITELASPINDITEDDIEKARIRADFEMKKKAALEAHKRYTEARLKESEEAKALPGDENPDMDEADALYSQREESEPKQNETFKPYIPDYMMEDTGKEEELKSCEKENTDSFQSFEASNKTNPLSSYRVDSASYHDAKEEPRQASAYSQYSPGARSSDAYRRAAEYANALRNHSSSAKSDDFKPYTPPKTEDIAPITEQIKEADSEDNSIKITRTMLSPEPKPIVTEEKSESDYSEVKFTEELPEKDESFAQAEPAEEKHGVEFEFENGEKAVTEEKIPEHTKIGVNAYDEEDPEEEERPNSEPEDDMPASDYEDEIPEEEQNEDVKKMRSMFPFLDSDSEDEEAESENYRDQELEYESGDSEAYHDESEDEDEPPFRDYTPISKQPAPKPEKPAPQQKPDYSDYKFPPLDLLTPGKTVEDPQQEEEKNINAEKLVDSLLQFGVRVSIKGIDRGPRITRYEIVPARGVKVNSVTNLFNDIALSLGAEGIRMEAPIPGKSAIGVEIPNKKPNTVLLRDLVESDEFSRSESKTMSCLGKDVTGNPVFADIAKMPHILIAGATGMGKSVCINAILTSILYKARPDEVKFIMIDPKKVEFNGYNGIPHLLVPVVTDVKQAAGALMWAVEQMEKRYDLMEKLEVRKLDAYNEKVRENPELGEPLPKIIIVIDELNDIMLQVRKPAEDLIMSIAQKARAAGIHLIIGTQRPSVDVITGVIKANIPSRISCKVASFNDSKTILEQAGAEKLLNNGDMLYIPAGAPKALRVQGAFVSDGEVSAVMKHLKTQAKGDIYDAQALEDINRAAQKCSKGGKGGDDFDEDEDEDEDVGVLNDQQFLDAVDIAIRSNKVSTSLLQRKIKIGYGKAAKFIDYMEEMGIVSEPNGQRPRDVLITKDEWHEMLARRSLD